MNQQINLYQPLFRRRKQVFSAQAIVVVTAVLVLALVLVFAYGRWQVHGLQAEVDRLAAQRDQAQQDLLTVSERLPKPERSKLLRAELERLEQGLADKKQVVALLGSGSNEDGRGFSAYLAGLARQHVSGTWLTAVAISEAGGGISVRGRTLLAERVPTLVQRLAAEEVFAGLRFRSLNIRRAARSSDGFDFSLTTRLQEN